MITLVPYVKAEDGYTVTDDAVCSLWKKLCFDGTSSTVFYDNRISTEDEFLAFFKSPSNLPVIVLVDDQIAGFAWINGVSSGFAFGHFAFFKEAWGKHTKEAGKRILDYWLSLGDKRPVLNTIIGMVPEFNERAVRFVESIGFTQIGSIPKLIPTPEGLLGVVLLYYQR